MFLNNPAHFWQFAPANLPLVRAEGWQFLSREGHCWCLGAGSQQRRAATAEAGEGDAWMTGSTNGHLNQSRWPRLLLQISAPHHQKKRKQPMIEVTEKLPLSCWCVAGKGCGSAGPWSPYTHSVQSWPQASAATERCKADQWPLDEASTFRFMGFQYF